MSELESMLSMATYVTFAFDTGYVIARTAIQPRANVRFQLIELQLNKLRETGKR